jgi:hypothetical protein
MPYFCVMIADAGKTPSGRARGGVDVDANPVPPW